MNYSGSHQERFDRAIYLTYVASNSNLDGIFKHVTKEAFYECLYHNVLDRIQTKDFDKTNVHRLADQKDIWLSKGGNVLGEVWKETDENGDYVESYWIDRKYFIPKVGNRF